MKNANPNNQNCFDRSSSSLPGLETRSSDMEAMLVEIHQMLAGQRPKKDWYTVREIAEILERSEFTVREWCRLGRVYADKRACGRGHSQEWIISAKELKRIQNEGLLPIERFMPRRTANGAQPRSRE